MEPMALGSAPSSPSSPTASANFLPAFLMGDTKASNSNQNAGSFSSPVRNKSFSYKVGTPEATNMRQKLFNNSGIEDTIMPVTYSNVDKAGPPKQSLFDTIDPSNASMCQNSSVSESFTRINSSVCENQVPIRSRSISLWVTVFGFPPSAASLILAQFAQCGSIVDKKFPTQGNWVSIKYNSGHEVAKALAMNGKLIHNSIMVGVIPFDNKEDKENVESPMYTSPIRARSLRQSLILPQNINMVVSPHNVPQKSTGLVSKAMEYVFGW